MRFIKGGKIFTAKDISNWWKSHTMAPSAVILNNSTIRVFLGCWDENGISRIGFVDIDSSNPLKIKNISKEPVLDIGDPGTFDENGVFPAHATMVGDTIFLYYTGFQLGHKIRHYNFGGLAKGRDSSEKYERVSKSPVLDRKDEGLLVRAGQSVLFENNIFKTVYSAGSQWVSAGDKMRPTYDVYYQESVDGISYNDKGKKIVEYYRASEHGLGRPQLIKLRDTYYIFFTRRTLDMKYFFGMAKSSDCILWERADGQIVGINHSINEWDSEMIYFPSVVATEEKIFLFYCGNNFGETGFGFAEINFE